jgi:hypothetical protein
MTMYLDMTPYCLVDRYAQFGGRFFLLEDTRLNLSHCRETHAVLYFKSQTITYISINNNNNNPLQ